MSKYSLKRSYYSKSIMEFFRDKQSFILGELTKHHQFALEDLQRNAWMAQIVFLKKTLQHMKDGHICFEYTIPRMGKRVDVILLYKHLIFVIEFKVGEQKFTKSAIEQVLDYSLDLKNFHEQSHSKLIIPVLLATKSPSEKQSIHRHSDGVHSPILVNESNFLSHILDFTQSSIQTSMIDPKKWVDSIYKPTPTIIQAAQALYNGHTVREISRADSGAINLTKTSSEISKIIDKSKRNNKKSICFVTGVPGAGKTLAGLNIANNRHNFESEEHAVFLSGNGPLVEVLQEALARNEVEASRISKNKIPKKIALSKTKAFIQNIHHFRDDNLMDNPTAPIERIVIFDEAQRAWTLDQTKNFMARKKGFPDFNQSEPNFLIGVMDRHTDWSVIICLIGGGQEINTGEAGLTEWFKSIEASYKHWDVYVSNKLTDFEYTNGEKLYSRINNNKLFTIEDLHLSVSVRSFRSEQVSTLIKTILDLNLEQAQKIFREVIKHYPIVLTRDLNSAKLWLKNNARGSERIGVIASSGACRLKSYGINVKTELDSPTWFLNPEDDVRSSQFLEDVATEYAIQGLELDWICLAWGADLRFKNGAWDFKNFVGTKWLNMHKEDKRRFLLNSYRVLLTRARQGLVIFISKGDRSDVTRNPAFYDETYQYLVDIGIQTI